MGMEIRDVSRHLTGVDLSKKMIEVAEKKKIYDYLEHNDILDYLSNNTLRFDLFVCSDVFIYCGDIAEIFVTLKKFSEKTALFAFTTEHNNSCNFRLEKIRTFLSLEKIYRKVVLSEWVQCQRFPIS